ncbi:uncharacterized protein J7T54_001520 [Emericellopsis cladophorae]|uniref:Uncharacterized protein n=1 Tax=Emericellopsis cladophorae TaxID=2686198 RepID=A0A9Q0BB38_9HYPO|nr:uncharacterized protein J7T54_001520 [Emericellopsis cladophorae]KAI6778100.1 hypothetical protein J7T54_001520 [Emericellopsis cladophorae]
MCSTHAACDTIRRQIDDLENQKVNMEQRFEKAWSDVKNVGEAAGAKVEGVFDSAELHFAELRKIRQQLADVTANETASMQQLHSIILSCQRSISRSLRSIQSNSGNGDSLPTTSQQDAEYTRPRDSTSPAEHGAIDAIRTDGNIDNVTEILQSPPARVVRFSEICPRGQATHRIVRARRDRQNLWFFSCRGSKAACVKKRVFYHKSDEGLLKAVSYHARLSHGIAETEWPEICRLLGTKVTGCTTDDARRNNEAFNGVVARLAHEENPRGQADREYKPSCAQSEPEQRTTRGGRRTAVRPPSETAAELEQEAETGIRASLERGISPPWDAEDVLQEASEHARAALTANTQTQHSPARFEIVSQAAPVAEMS